MPDTSRLAPTLELSPPLPARIDHFESPEILLMENRVANAVAALSPSAYVLVPRFCYPARPFPPRPPPWTPRSATSQVMHKLPGERHDVAGRPHVDYRAVLALAWPFVLTVRCRRCFISPKWFIGHSPRRRSPPWRRLLAGLVFVLLLGWRRHRGTDAVAQANGGRAGVARRRRSGTRSGDASYGAAVSRRGMGGPGNAASVALEPAVRRQALEFWVPRMIGGADGVALWAVLGFFQSSHAPRYARDHGCSLRRSMQPSIASFSIWRWASPDRRGRPMSRN